MTQEKERFCGNNAPQFSLCAFQDHGKVNLEWASNTEWIPGESYLVISKAPLPNHISLQSFEWSASVTKAKGNIETTCDWGSDWQAAWIAGHPGGFIYLVRTEITKTD